MCLAAKQKQDKRYGDRKLSRAQFALKWSFRRYKNRKSVFSVIG